MALSDDRQYAPATLRDRDFILDVLRDVLPMTGVILEIASGSGEHVVHFARNLPSLVFQPSDPDPDARLSVAAWVKATGVTNVRAPFALDTPTATNNIEFSNDQKSRRPPLGRRITGGVLETQF